MSPTRFRMPDPTPGELRALQLERLRDTLARVYEHVPHYRRAFDAAGVSPADARRRRRTSPASPSPSRRTCARNYPFGMFAVPARRGQPRARLLGHDRASRPSWATPTTTSTPGPS